MKYRHYKGGVYIFMCEAIHAESCMAYVVYRDATDLKKVWIRPAREFYEDVAPGVKRFEQMNTRVCIIEVCPSGRNEVREVWMTRSALETLKATRNVRPHLTIASTGILPLGDWDYIFAFNSEKR